MLGKAISGRAGANVGLPVVALAGLAIARTDDHIEQSDGDPPGSAKLGRNASTGTVRALNATGECPGPWDPPPTAASKPSATIAD
jgi:hypothetical protein